MNRKMNMNEYVKMGDKSTLMQIIHKGFILKVKDSHLLVESFNENEIQGYVFSNCIDIEDFDYVKLKTELQTLNIQELFENEVKAVVLYEIPIYLCKYCGKLIRWAHIKVESDYNKNCVICDYDKDLT